MKTEEYSQLLLEMERIIKSLQVDSLRKELASKDIVVDDCINLIKERIDILKFNLTKAKFYLAGAIDNLKDEELDKYKLELYANLKDKIIKYEEKIKEQENYINLANSENKNTEQADLDYNLALAKSTIEVTKNFKKTVEEEMKNIENLKREEIISAIKENAHLSENSEYMIKQNQLIARLPLLINSNEYAKVFIKDVINGNKTLKEDLNQIHKRELDDYIAKYDKIREGLGDNIDRSSIYSFTIDFDIDKDGFKPQVFLDLLTRSYENLRGYDFYFLYVLENIKNYKYLKKSSDKEIFEFTMIEVERHIKKLSDDGFFKWSNIDVLGLLEKKDYKRLKKILIDSRNRFYNVLEGLKVLKEEISNSIKTSEKQDDVYLSLMKKNIDRLLDLRDYFDSEKLLPDNVLKEELVSAYNKTNRKSDERDEAENINYYIYPNLTLGSIKGFLKIINDSEETIEEYSIENIDNKKK